MKLNPKISEIKIQSNSIYGLDLETSGLDPLTCVPLILALSDESETYVLELREYSKAEINELLANLKKAAVVVAHNAKFDMGFILKHYRIALPNIFCTQLASEILENKPNVKGHSLVDVLKRYLNVELLETKDKKALQESFIGKTLSSRFTPEQLEYAASDTKYLPELYKEQWRRIERYEMQEIMLQENSLINVLVKLELGGCLIDTKRWRVYLQEWEKELEPLDKELQQMVYQLSLDYPVLRLGKGTIRPVCDMFGGGINFGSSKQVSDLFRLMEEPVPQEKGKESVGETALTNFVNENPRSPLRPLVQKLLDYREIVKLLSTYGESFLARLDINNFIHTSYTQCMTDTGRLSSRDPNLQNIPSRGKGSVLRSCFIPRPGYKFITSDMASAEIRIAADYSKEPRLRDNVLNGADLHSFLATKSFRIIFNDRKFEVSESEEEVEVAGIKVVPKKLRTLHKQVTFAKFYKAGAGRVYSVLAEYINLLYPPSKRLSIARRVSNEIDNALPTLTAYLTAKINEANKYGMLRGVKGRIRWFGENAYGNAANFPIQNANAEAIKIAMLEIDKYFEENRYGRLVMNIHDEVVVEVKDEFTEEVKPVIQDIMTRSLGAVLTELPGGASASIDLYWKK